MKNTNGAGGKIEIFSAQPQYKVLGYNEQLGVVEILEDGSIKKLEFERGEPCVFAFSFIVRHLRWLQGEILTVVDASIADERQVKAVKDLVKNKFSSKIDWIYEQSGLSESDSELLPDPE